MNTQQIFTTQYDLTEFEEVYQLTKENHWLEMAEFKVLMTELNCNQRFWTNEKSLSIYHYSEGNVVQMTCTSIDEFNEYKAQIQEFINEATTNGT